MNEDLYGTDLAMDETSDLQATPGGDLALLTGPANLGQAIASRLLTEPSEYLFGDGTYGCTLRQYVDAIITPEMEAQATQDITAGLLQDSRIGSVTQVLMTSDGVGDLTVTVDTMSAYGDASSVEVTP